jgi:hypothetical protein
VANVLFFVSKRLQFAAATAICLMLAQLFVAAMAAPAQTGPVVRVGISR